MKWMKNWLRSLFVMLMLLTGAAHAAESDYVIGPGDVIRVLVYQQPDMTLETRVTDSGNISYPLLGTIKLGGLTVREAETKIAQGLRDGNYFKQPQVSIVVTDIKSSQVSVLGAVSRAGRYPLELNNTKLSYILAMAGGTIVNGSSDIVVLMGTRGGKPFRKEIDVPLIFAANNPSEDPVLQNGDTIYVGTAPYVYVYGEVTSPGIKSLQRDMTVMQALAAAGGLNLRGTTKGMTIHRRDAATGKVKAFEPAMNELVQKDDVLFVKESLF